MNVPHVALKYWMSLAAKRAKTRPDTIWVATKGSISSVYKAVAETCSVQNPILVQIKMSLRLTQSSLFLCVAKKTQGAW